MVSIQLRLATLGFLLGGCGYSNIKANVNLAGPANLPQKNVSHVQKVFIPVVDNLTARPGLEIPLTNSFRENLAAVKNLEVVNSPEAADFLLLGTVTSYSRLHGLSLITGDSGSAAAGGLSANQGSAADIQIAMAVNIKLLQKISENPPVRKQLWTRNFNQSATFEASQRFTEVMGASSAPHINESREMVQVQILSDNMARQVIDQVTQDF